jgi:hypothetical protein
VENFKDADKLAKILLEQYLRQNPKNLPTDGKEHGQLKKMRENVRVSFRQWKIFKARTNWRRYCRRKRVSESPLLKCVKYTIETRVKRLEFFSTPSTRANLLSTEGVFVGTLLEYRALLLLYV